jgi:hypothetical protein
MRAGPQMVFKKPSYPISSKLEAYLERYKRSTNVPVHYEDLLRFSGSVSVYSHQDDDTLWVRVFYAEEERKEIDIALKKIYSILHSDGSDTIFEDLSVDAIDYCTFGNSKPFRIKIRNIINDNYTYFYVKRSDASRIYGLELEHLLSPYNLNFLVSRDTLIEEHIAGIPGDVFIARYLPLCSERQRAQLAKEFVKFNERCMIRLLGDMRAYNYVIIPVHDFDSVIHKIRAIDFDQQNYEGDLKVYRPQFFSGEPDYDRINKGPSQKRVGVSIQERRAFVIGKKSIRSRISTSKVSRGGQKRCFVFCGAHRYVGISN